MPQATQSNLAEHADIDEKYWRAAILQKPYYRGEIGFDRYRWALNYGQMARKRHGHDVKIDQVLQELADGWSKFGGPSGLTWEEAHEAVKDSWNYTDTLVAESIAKQAGFKSPPTFTEHGARVPRNLDEPNL
jgi:hypothetical protein